jgi:hypothetical protein
MSRDHKYTLILLMFMPTGPKIHTHRAECGAKLTGIQVNRTGNSLDLF